jgi:HEAT repeat protein
MCWVGMKKYTQEKLIEMMSSSNLAERIIAAEDVKKHYLSKMMNDIEWRVRFRVAQRINKKDAVLMWATDEDEWVRSVAMRNAMGIK